jgi:3-oxoacyl-[acyl-carrier protein] reductase
VSEAEQTRLSPPATPLPSALSLAGQRVVVTGAASGIGRATASALASLGADLLLADVANLEATIADLAARGVTPETSQGDLLAPGAVDRLFVSKPVRALVHCAGIVPGPPWDEDPDWEGRFARTMAVNVRLPIELGHACINHMKEHGGGRVVLIGSLAGLTGGTLLTTPPDYAASKGGLHAVVHLLARKAAPWGVLVNGVAPGPVNTSFSTNFPFPRELFPLGRMAEPEEIAWPIAFLCTAAACNMVGEIVNVNGGLYSA